MAARAICCRSPLCSLGLPSRKRQANLGRKFNQSFVQLPFAHVGDHFECGGNLAQIARDGLLLEQKPQAERFNGALFLIDLRVERRDLLCKRAVALVERLCREGNDFLAQSAHADHFTVQLVELLVKPVSHHPNLPVM